MRMRRPCRSSTLRSSRRNQPPICTKVSPTGIGSRPNGRYASSHSSRPPPLYSQPLISLAVMPNGSALKNWNVGLLPFQ